MVAGQISGGFAQALGAALYEEYVYAPDGSFLSGTFADYLVPTAMEVPEPVILHRESPSPLTPLGAKGVGEGNCMSTPVCIANAIADALQLDAIDLPATPAKLAAYIHGPEAERAGHTAPVSPAAKGERQLFGEGRAEVSAPPDQVWRMLLDPATLAAVVPGAHGIEKISDTHFRAQVTLGIREHSGRRQDQGKGEVCRRVGQHPRRVADGDSGTCGRCDVDVVVADRDGRNHGKARGGGDHRLAYAVRELADDRIGVSGRLDDLAGRHGPFGLRHDNLVIGEGVEGDVEQSRGQKDAGHEPAVSHDRIGGSKLRSELASLPGASPVSARGAEFDRGGSGGVVISQR
jgi:2-furoyl-CoA dehydrogenase large subunit